MFQTGELKVYNLIDNNKQIGLIQFNPHFNYTQETTRPFIRCSTRTVEKLGRVNYEMLDQFIINSLNDYYSKIQSVEKEEDRNQYVAQYQQLYFLWQKVIQAKQAGDFNVNSYYDDIVYRLYLLGYRN